MIFIPSQFVVPFFIILGVVILVCGIMMIISKFGTKHESAHVRAVTKSQEQIKMMAKGTMQNIIIFETLDTGKKLKMVLPQGAYDTVLEGETGLLEYAAIRGIPTYFKSFTKSNENEN